MTVFTCSILDQRRNVLRQAALRADTRRRAVDEAIALQLVTRGAAGFEVFADGQTVEVYHGRRPAWSSRPRILPQAAE